MARISAQSAAAWELAASQDGVICWDQLRALGFSREAIAHRLRTGRLHRIWRGVYAVGRRPLTRRGLWRAATYAGGDEAALSHGSGLAFWGIRAEPDELIHLSIPSTHSLRLAGIRAHRRSNLHPSEIVVVDGIRVTAPATALIDVATDLSHAELERAINEADKRGFVSVDALRSAVGTCPPRPGRGKLGKLLDRHILVLTDSDLERRFVPLARRAGLGKPQTGVWLNGFRVDFYWPELGLVVETDGLRYHRTPAQQAKDRRRDQAHTAAGLTPLRFTHAQVAYEPRHVEATLRKVAVAARSYGP